MNALLLLLVTFHAHAGSFTSNGADRKGPGHGAAWFLGSNAVKWCANSDAVTPALDSAAAKWNGYLAAKHVTDALRAPLPFALRFERQASCAGADLVIDVSEDKEATVFSGSELLAQDLERGWGKGRIWLSSALLADPTALETQLVHQLGHVLGNDHVGGTVMAEDVANLAKTAPVLPSIDGARELYLCLSCPVDLTGPGGTSYREGNGVAAVNGLALRFTAELAHANFGDAKVFSVALGALEAHLGSLSLARLAVDAAGRQVIVRRNFDHRAEADLLVGGRPQRIFGAAP